MNINEFLATEVMGWRRKKGRHDAHGPILHTHYIDPANKDFWLDAHDWNPTENIEQAMICYLHMTAAGEQWEGSIDSLQGGHCVQLFTASLEHGSFVDKHGMGESEFLSEGTSLACARAAGWKE